MCWILNTKEVRIESHFSQTVYMSVQILCNNGGEVSDFDWTWMEFLPFEREKLVFRNSVSPPIHPSYFLFNWVLHRLPHTLLMQASCKRSLCYVAAQLFVPCFLSENNPYSTSLHRHTDKSYMCIGTAIGNQNVVGTVMGLENRLFKFDVNNFLRFYWRFMDGLHNHTEILRELDINIVHVIFVYLDVGERKCVRITDIISDTFQFSIDVANGEAVNIYEAKKRRRMELKRQSEMRREEEISRLLDYKFKCKFFLRLSSSMDYLCIFTLFIRFFDIFTFRPRSHMLNTLELWSARTAARSASGHFSWDRWTNERLLRCFSRWTGGNTICSWFVSNKNVASSQLPLWSTCCSFHHQNLPSQRRQTWASVLWLFY